MKNNEALLKKFIEVIPMGRAGEMGEIASFVSYIASEEAAFITGQNPYRTGLTKVGMPGADIGLRAEDPTIATALKSLGYTTGQFGKNHFGDRDEFLPTAHGFDEFFGNLYHLNAEEEPELRDYPKEDDPEFPNFRKRFAPRGVLHCWANGDGSQRIESTGPLTRKRMETADDEFMVEAKRFIRDAVASGEPFFVWFNTTHMHFRTYARPQDIGRSGRWQSEYHDVMIYHDECIGEMLNLLDELGIADNTIVVYSSDQGFFLGEHGWFDKRWIFEELARTPLLVRWPGVSRAGSVSKDIVSNLDFAQTFLDAAGVAAPVDMQGRSLRPVLAGQRPADWRTSFYYQYFEWPRPHHVRPHYGVITDRYKLVHFFGTADDYWELYDREKDPMELRNVLADPAYAKTKVELEQELARLRRELKVPERIPPEWLGNVGGGEGKAKKKSAKAP